MCELSDKVPLLSQHADRKIPRSIHEPARDVARAVARTRLYKQSRKDRKKVEMLFAHLKRILKLDRLRLRGPSGAHDEFLLAATAQNLGEWPNGYVHERQYQRSEAHRRQNCEALIEKAAIRTANIEKMTETQPVVY